MTQQIRRIDPLSAAKMLAVVNGLLGLIIIPIFLVMQSVLPSDPAMPGFGMGVALVIPLIYAGGGFLFGLIGTTLYNLVAGWVGGIEVELG